jgi:hypothetical protein
VAALASILALSSEKWSFEAYMLVFRRPVQWSDRIRPRDLVHDNDYHLSKVEEMIRSVRKYIFGLNLLIGRLSYLREQVYTFNLDKIKIQRLLSTIASLSLPVLFYISGQFRQLQEIAANQPGDGQDLKRNAQNRCQPRFEPVGISRNNSRRQYSKGFIYDIIGEKEDEDPAFSLSAYSHGFCTQIED